MSLSKIHRGPETGDLKEFHFRSFGDGDGGVVPLAEKRPAAGAAVVAAAPAGATPQQVQEAYARGRQEGLAAGEARLEATTQALSQALEDVCRLRESLAQNGAQDMLRLVMAVAEQVVRRSIAADRDAIIGIISSALQASVRSDSYRIRVSPADLEVVTKQKPLFLASLSGLKNLTIEADPSITPGGCRVDSDLGDVDATIETQLDTIRQTLEEAITEG